LSHIVVQIGANGAQILVGRYLWSLACLESAAKINDEDI